MLVLVVFLVVRGLDTAPPPSPRPCADAVELGRFAKIVREPVGNLPPELRAAIGDEFARIENELVPRTSLRPRRRGVPPDLAIWAFDLRFGLLPDPANRLRIGHEEIGDYQQEKTLDGVRWSPRGTGGILVAPAGHELPPGEITVDYRPDFAELAELEFSLAQQSAREFVFRSLTVDQITWQAFQLPAPTTIALDVALGSAPELRFTAGLQSVGEVAGDGVAVVVRVGEEEVLRHHLAPGASNVDLVVDLAPHARTAQRLTIESDPGPAGDLVGDYLFLGNPRLVDRSTAGTVPNVVFILVDTVRADHLGCYGYGRPTSPHVDALADRGVRFDRVSAQSSWTRPSMASIFTSLAPSQHGVLRVDFNQVLRESFTTLAEHLRDAGYATASFVNNAQMGPDFGMTQGFGRTRLAEGDDRALVDDVLEWLEVNADTPFFLYAHLVDPHDPYAAHPEFDFMPDYEGRVFDIVDDLIVDREALVAVLGQLDQVDVEIPYRDLADDELAKMIALYDGEIAFSDAQVGRLVAWLDERGLFENTLVVFTSDHGEEFGEHGGYYHGYTLYEEVVRVPLVLAGIGLPGGVVRDERVMHVDLLPTILDLLALPSAEVAMGGSLVPLMTGEGPAPSGLTVMETGFRVPHRIASWDENKKFILQTVTEEVEVYDLPVDPREQQDVGEKEADAARKMARRLSEWSRRQRERFEEHFRESGERTVAPEVIEEMRKLGYVLDG